MKKPLRLIAALLAVCVLTAAFPPVGLAAEGDLDLRDYVNNAVDNVADLRNATVLLNDTDGSGSKDVPYIINKPVTIQNGTIDVRAGGFVLNADVTFSNVKFLFSATAGNFIAANGHTLTLDNVQCTGTYSCDVFGGTMTGVYEYFSIPAPGVAGNIIISGNTSLQGTLKSGNIYAGSLFRSSDGTGGTPEFTGDVSISISGKPSAGALGTIYASGAIKNGTAVTPGSPYTVSGTVSVTGSAIPNVDGAGSGRTTVVYQGDGNQASATFTDISSLTLESGNLAPTANSYFRDGGTLSLGADAKLNLSQFLKPIPVFHGNGGVLILAKDQTFHFGQADGTAKVAIGNTTSDGAGSSAVVTEGHIYLQTPGDSAVNFQLLPYANQPDMTLVKDSNGNWTASAGSSGETINRVTSFQIIPDQVAITMAEDAEVEMEASFETTEWPMLDFIPLTISVNGKDLVAVEDQENAGYYTYTYQYGVLEMTVMDNYLCISPDRQYSADAYKIQVTIPAKYNGTGQTLTDSVTLTVTDGGTTPDPTPTSIPVPTANTGLKWTGTVQTGVNPGTGYTLSGHTGTGVGNYTATATLESNYQWNDGTTDPQTIDWSIARADGPAAPAGLAGAAPSTSGGTDGKITGTAAAMEYASTADFAGARACGEPETAGLSAGTYYVRYRQTATHEAGASTSITVPAPGAPVVTGISVNSTAHKTEYKVGEALDVTGLTIEVTYSDGNRLTVAVTESMVTGFNSAQAAESQTLTITHEGHTATCTVKITAPEQPGEPQHTHAWDTAWKNDAAHHWHDCTAPDCTLTGNSQKDGYAAHTAGDWVVDRPATSTQSGTRHRSCTVCGYEMARETIPATGGGSSSGGSSSGGSSSGGSSSSGSSSSGSSGTTTSVKNPDGSTTSTTTNKATGTVTETTRRPDGSKTVVETKKDGTVTTTETAKDGSTVKTVARPNGTTETSVKQANGLTATVQERPNSAEATVRIPSKVAGSGVTLPIPALPGENASVTVHTGTAQPALVKIPVDGNDATTVACLVNSDGSETILKTAFLTGGQIAVSVPDGATVHIRDNGKEFQDVRGHWAKNAIDFVTARELFTGNTFDTFTPDGSMSRAMLATVLARLDGVDTTGDTAYRQGMSWAVAQGISDGWNPDSQVTREQFVSMLHRYAGNPAATNRELRFRDSAKVDAYAWEASLWATENGILNGYEDGSFDPKGKITRAQAAVMLTRYVELLNQK